MKTSSAHPLVGLQWSVGNQAFQRLTNSPYIQTKLQVSTPGDPFEKEADHVADTVMRMPEPEANAKDAARIQPKPLAPRITPLLQREPERPLVEEKKEAVTNNGVVQRAPLAAREDDDEKVATKLDTDTSPLEKENEKKVETKLSSRPR